MVYAAGLSIRYFTSSNLVRSAIEGAHSDKKSLVITVRFRMPAVASAMTGFPRNDAEARLVIFFFF